MGHSEIMPYYLTHGGQRAALNVIDEWHFFNTGMEEAPWFRLYCFNSSEGAIQSLAEGYDLVDEKGEYKVLVYQRKEKEPQEQ
jgi:hypothetical protein